MKKKEEVISFKVDEAMMEVLKDIPNRSEFIRRAIMEVLGTACPLCNGRGILTPSQFRHWQDFSTHHSVSNCEECKENYLVCFRES